MHHFGSEVRRARKEAGMTLAELGDQVPCDSSTVSRIEAGLITPDLHFAEVCDRAFPFGRGWFSRFLADSQDWDGNPALAPAFRDFADDERQASALYTFEHSLLPGLLQTPDYARAVLATYPRVTEAQVTERTSARLCRQAILTADGPPWLWAVIDEGALHHEVGGPRVMHAALLHLAKMASLPNVSVQVLPRGVHVGAQGAFAIAEADGTGNSAFVEDATDGHTTDDTEVVNLLSVRFRWLQTLAMTPGASLDMMEMVSDGYDVAQIEL
jgi:transcriptional regulator with XRE-family HTH domain